MQRLSETETDTGRDHETGPDKRDLWRLAFGSLYISLL